MADKRGRDAQSPTEIPPLGWRDIAWRVWDQVNEDRILLIAAGATFYMLLALFPALAAFVSLYGFVADPITIADHIAFLGGLLPSGGLELLRSELLRLVDQEQGAMTTGFIFGLAVALWSANNGMKTLFEALNVAYEEAEKRGFVSRTLLSLGFTIAAMGLGAVMIFSVGVMPVLLEAMYLGRYSETIISLLRWPVLLVLVAAAISILYRYGPSREQAKWRWITWGSGFATVVWLLASAGFSFYLQHFADYNATYGSLGAIMGLMLWTWISIIVLLIGAELNAEMERQTMRDSTTGPELPLGERGAVVADTVGKTWEDAG